MNVSNPRYIKRTDRICPTRVVLYLVLPAMSGIGLLWLLAKVFA